MDAVEGTFENFSLLGKHAFGDRAREEHTIKIPLWLIST